VTGFKRNLAHIFICNIFYKFASHDEASLYVIFLEYILLAVLQPIGLDLPSLFFLSSSAFSVTSYLQIFEIREYLLRNHSDKP